MMNDDENDLAALVLEDLGLGSTNPYLMGTHALAADTTASDDDDGDVFELLGVDIVPFAPPEGNWNRYPNVVTQVQQALKDKGYGADLGTSGANHDGVDGSYGTHTGNAIANFHKSRGEAQGRDIDNTLLTALGVPVPSSTTAGSSASAARQDTQAMARGDVPPDTDHAKATSDAAADVAKKVDDAKTSAQLTAYYAALTGMMTDPNTPPPSPEVKKKMDDAKQAVTTAKTPAEIKDAKDKLADAGKAVAAEKAPGWFSKPIFTGGTVRRWQGITIAGASVAVLTGFIFVARR